MSEPVPCPRCGEPIVWVRMERTGCKMALEPEPSTSGTMELVGGNGVARVVPRSERDGRPLFVSHYRVCRVP